MRGRHRLPWPALASLPPLVVVVTALIGLLAMPAAAAKAPRPCQAPYNPVINPADFTDGAGHPNAIDNPYFPLAPGTTFVYEGTEAGHAERDVVHVTHQTRTIQGVPAIAVRDQLTIDGRLAELTFDWYAQDRQGNVWYLGEDSEEYGKKGKVSTKGSWEPGVGGAKPGIIMEAQPKVRDTYRQEYARREAEDMATVLSLTEHVTVPYGSFDNVLQTREFSCIERGAEHKYYAPGVGDVLEVSVRGGHERLELKEIKTEPD